MRELDRILLRWRIRKAGKYIPSGARVLDIGSFDGTLFRQLSDRVAGGAGIDPLAPASEDGATFRLIRGRFPEDMPDLGLFDVVTALAVVEHLATAGGPRFAESCARFLIPKGLLIATVPGRSVDTILRVLCLLRLIDGMSLEQHHGFTARSAVELFTSRGFALCRSEKFQLGLNTVLVFRKLP